MTLSVSLRVFLAEDHTMFREALRLVLEREADIEVVGEASDGQQLLQQVAKVRPDIVCCDINMPGLDGIEATRRLADLCPDTLVVGLSAHADRQFVLEMLQAGAKGYVVKSEAGEELLRAIRAVRTGRTYLSPLVANVVAEALMDHGKGGPAAAQLTPRERQVIRLIAQGHTTTQIADRLFLAPATVEVHRRNLARKLGLHSIAELTRYAVRQGLVTD